MRKSAFQFSDPCLREVHFTVNEEYTAPDEKNVEVGIKIGVKVNKVDGKNEATVELSIEVGDMETAPFHICVTEGANFRWENMEDEKRLDRFLEENAPALLLGYIRPVIANLTASSRYKAYNLPFIDFTEEKK